MGRLGTAFKIFFKALGDAGFADRADKLLLQPAAAAALPAPSPAATPAKIEPANQRSDALNLLQVLQREARLVDFLMEPIDAYDDAQIGSAVRNIHRDSSAVLKRLFSLKPVLTQPEGEKVRVPTGADAGRYRLIGNVAGNPPFTGTLRHAGWEATQLQLPSWSGSAAAAYVIAPAEVEV